MDQATAYYPEGCDPSGAGCSQCVGRTARAVKMLTANPTAEWASVVFHQMYTYAACRQMEHMFVYSCGVELVQIEAAAA